MTSRQERQAVKRLRVRWGNRYFSPTTRGGHLSTCQLFQRAIPQLYER